MLESLLPDALDGVSLGSNVLELGPGPGLTTVALARLAPQVTAIEIDRELAQAARERTRPAATSRLSKAMRPRCLSMPNSSAPSSA